MENTTTARGLIQTHWPALDGLRGSAIIAVLVCHYAVLLPRSPWVYFLEIGWAGVDLFFVLSGFLITGILLDTKGTPNAFRNFYARRALRIFPLYFGVLVSLLLVAAIVWLVSPASREGLRQFWAAQPSLWTFTANYWLPAQISRGQVPFSPWVDVVTPLWSLAVEEQFYFLWPLVVARLSGRGLVRVCVGIIVGALLVRIGLTAVGVKWIWLYVGTPARADALAAGALLAVLFRRLDDDRLRKLRRRLAWIGGVSLVLVIALNGGFDPTRHPWQRVFLYSALAGFFVALLFWATDARSLRGIPNRFYSVKLLRLAGRYSFGMYVLHMPLVYLTLLASKQWGWYDPMQPTWGSACGMVAANVLICCAVAVISFHGYEKPFLKLKCLFAATAVTPAAGRCVTK